jgi:hypothetical protein
MSTAQEARCKMRLIIHANHVTKHIAVRFTHLSVVWSRCSLISGGYNMLVRQDDSSCISLTPAKLPNPLNMSKPVAFTGWWGKGVGGAVASKLATEGFTVAVAARRLDEDDAKARGLFP